MNYQEAKKQYHEIRKKVYQKVETELTDRFQKSIQLTHIDINALKAWREQWCPRLAERKRFTEEELLWNWVNTIREMSNVPSRFELAIWSDKILCGLAIGKPSKGPTHNAIYRLQGSPIRHPLEGKIMTIAIKTGTEYAKALGKKNLILVEPLEHLVKIYQRHGFTLKTSKHYPRCYCIKEV